MYSCNAPRRTRTNSPPHRGMAQEADLGTRFAGGRSAYIFEAVTDKASRLSVTLDFNPPFDRVWDAPPSNSSPLAIRHHRPSGSIHVPTPPLPKRVSSCFGRRPLSVPFVACLLASTERKSLVGTGPPAPPTRRWRTRSVHFRSAHWIDRHGLQSLVR